MFAADSPTVVTFFAARSSIGQEHMIDSNGSGAQHLHLGDPGIDENWIRRHRQGGRFMLVWILAWMIVMCAGVLTHVGPFGWLASLELRAIGSDDPVLTALPALILMLAPGLAAMCTRKDASRPFLFGIQDSLDPQRHPILVLPPRNLVRRYRTIWRASLVVCVLCLIALGIGVWKIEHTGSDPRIPLPILRYPQVASGNALPTAARIDGVVAHTQAAWIHNYSIRQTRYRSVYYPLAPAGWMSDQPVRLLELDSIIVGDDPAPYNAVNAPGPREGTLYKLNDDWIAGELRRSGLKLSNPVMVLERRQLHGLQPQLDAVDAFADFILPAIIIGFVAALMAWASRRQLRLHAPVRSHNHLS
jgi:hypothetical protein